VYRDCGPLGGIHAALSKSKADLNLMMAVDMPFVTPELLRFLRDKAVASNATVTIPRTERGLQPLCAIYRSAFAAVADCALRDKKYKIDALFSEVSILVIEPEELGRMGFSERTFFNVNTPEDLNAARGG
jgi:molybdopterin-guanine dinucleotide biosynthesis protein A